MQAIPATWVQSSKVMLNGNTVLIIVLAGQLFAGACSDRRESVFASVKEARSSGWIPGGLPESATDVRELHDVDTNEVWGTFRLSASEHSSISLTRVDESKITGQAVRSPRTSWWPEMLTGKLNGPALEQRGFEFYSAPAAPFEFWIAIERDKGQGFFWLSPR